MAGRSERWRGRRQYLLSHKSKSREHPVQASSCRVTGSELCWSCPLACLKRLPVEGNDNWRFRHTCEPLPHSQSYANVWAPASLSVICRRVSPCLILSHMQTRQRNFPLGLLLFNPLTPNDHYRGRTAPLTSKRCILYIYSTNIVTEYFKHGIYSPFFSLQNAVCFIILTYLVPYYSHFIYSVC